MSEGTAPIQISGIQHYAFCPRRWALIHIEQLWQDNVHTVQGDLFHARVHDADASELRGDTLTLRGMHVFSRAMDLTGICDAVEFHRCPNGISLNGYEGLWSVRPVEYKVGTGKYSEADSMQLCAQALCLEEMLACAIPEADIYYGQPRRRVHIPLDEPLRSQVKAMISEMKGYMKRGYTPKARPSKACFACSMNELCLPQLPKLRSASRYISDRIREDVPCENS